MFIHVEPQIECGGDGYPPRRPDSRRGELQQPTGTTGVDRGFREDLAAAGPAGTARAPVFDVAGVFHVGARLDAGGPGGVRAGIHPPEAGGEWLEHLPYRRGH